jgi:hypothetical protein
MKKNECYIDFLDCKNKFRETRKEFENFEAAKKWMLENFEKPDVDFIKYF